LSELFKTERVVPVVIFLNKGRHAEALTLGGDRHHYLTFRYLSCDLGNLPFERYKDSDNIVARLNLPNMAYPKENRVEVYAHAVRGLYELEPQPEKQLKYLDFIDIYAGLDDNELQMYRDQYPEEAEKVSNFAERFRAEGLEQGLQQGVQQGLQQGMQQGMQQGEALALERQLTLKFGELPEAVRQRIAEADADTLIVWLERVLTASSLDEVLG